MTKPIKAASNKENLKLHVQRIRVNAQGYDTSGAYWGAGPDVFIVRNARLRHDATSANGTDEVTVRARSISEARDKVAAELARQPGTAPISDDPIGGAAPRKTRYEIDWLNPLTAEVVRIRITHARDYLVQSTDHIEVESIRPKRAPLPITATGYLSHFIPALDLINAGGPVAFVKTWIEREAAGKAWQKQATIKAQGDLFQWAEATKEVGGHRQPKPKPSKPVPKPRKKPARTRAPG